MRRRIGFALLVATTLAVPAAAQDKHGGVRTETMERMASQNTGMDLIWNIIGLFGLVGLLGMRREHPDDSYHPSEIE